MTQLMRNGLEETIYPISQLREPNFGLLMQRGLREWDSDNKTDKESLIHYLGLASAPEIYKKAYQRWEQITLNNPNIKALAMEVNGRLYAGLSSVGALETGVSVHHTYGMPILTGSSVKGIVNAFARELGLPENICAVLFGNDDNTAGAVVWHDAWWMPILGTKPFAKEIITVHHQKYYGGEKPIADEMEDPIPNQQIGIQGSFYFAVEGVSSAWADFAINLLQQALEQHGIGAKTASGYGFLKESISENNRLKSIQEEAEKKRQAQAKQNELNSLPEHKRIITEWTDLLSGQERFSANEQKHSDLFKKLCQELRQASEGNKLNSHEKKEIAEALSVRKLQTWQRNWLTAKREREIRDILRQLRGE